jgi:putative membrane protein
MRWGWGGMFMGLFFLLFIGLIIYLMVKSIGTTKPGAISKEETSLGILKKRYVKGEINKEEYDRIKKDLQD